MNPRTMDYYRALYEETGECLIWTGPQNGRGYGTVRHASVWGVRESWLVHRLSWSEQNGPIPLGYIIRHRCDNKLCYRADHLEIGTTQQNADDYVARRAA